MIVSVNWLKKYTDIEIPISELVELIGSRLVEVESVEDLSKKYKDVVIAQVILAQKIEDSDHLTQALIDDGGVVDGVERDKDGYIQVVCGASNVRPGMLVAWLPPNTIVPSTLGTKEPFLLEPRKFMGVKSQGMLASPRELDLYDEHEGILEIEEGIEPGSYFVDLYGLNDYLLDIENKSLTHRPDAFGIIGFAREVAGIQGKQFQTPDWLSKKYPVNTKSDLTAPNVFIDSPNAAEKYELVLLEGNFAEGTTPDEIKSYLSRVGMRPVDPLVDATNYMMLISGQPLHVFDYDKMVALCGGEPEIHIRYAKSGETLETLDGNIIDLDENDIVIVADDHIVALAGAMGGKSTMVDENTKRVLLESATFNLYNLRTTQMRHGIFSEAITRFTKGQPAEQTTPVLVSAIALLDKWTDVSNVSTIKSAQDGAKKDSKENIINLNLDNINSVLSSSLSGEEIKSILGNVELNATVHGDNISVDVPWWRKDLKIKEDIIEEIGRLRGYDNIDPSLPTRKFKAISQAPFDAFKANIRQLFSSAGANEVLTYSFIPKKLMDQTNQDSDNAFRVVNSISPELEHYRLSLMPSLLKTARMNLKQGYSEFAIFEINKVHAHSRGLTEDSVPVEGYNLAGVVYHKDGSGGAEYYQAKKFVDYLLKKFNINLEYTKLDLNKNSLSMFTPFEAKRSAMLKDPKSGDLIGVVGEYNVSVKKNFKLPQFIAGFEINLIKLFEIYQNSPHSVYTPVIRYPAVERDICFQVKEEVMYSKLLLAVESALTDFDGELNINPIDIYSGDGNQDLKNITIRIRLQPSTGTLTGDEVERLVKKTEEHVKEAVNGKMV